MTRAVNTTRPLAVPYVSTDPTRVLDVLHGVLLLGDPCTNTTHPSALASDLLARLVVLAQIPGSTSGPDTSPQAQAFTEAAAMLGAYLRRLEDVARAHGRCGS